MPAKSASQQRYFGWLEHSPDAASERKSSKGMSHQQMHDFAATSTKNLPEHAGKKFYGQGKPPERTKPKPNRFYGET